MKRRRKEKTKKQKKRRKFTRNQVQKKVRKYFSNVAEMKKKKVTQELNTKRRCVTQIKFQNIFENFFKK